MKQSNLCQYFAGRTKEIFPTGTTPIRPFTTKPVMDIAFSVGIFVGYKGLKWVRDFHVNHIVAHLRMLHFPCDGLTFCRVSKPPFDKG